MLRWAIIFAVVALVAGLLGFGGIAGAAAGVAKILFFLFLAVVAFFVVAGVSGTPQRRPATVGPEYVVHEARLSVSGIEDDGASPIAE